MKKWRVLFLTDSWKTGKYGKGVGCGTAECISEKRSNKLVTDKMKMTFANINMNTATKIMTTVSFSDTKVRKNMTSVNKNMTLVKYDFG